MKDGGESDRTLVRSRMTLNLRTPGGSLAAPALPKIRRAAKFTDWADEHKQRIQADMDALEFGSAPIERRRGR